MRIVCYIAALLLSCKAGCTQHLPSDDSVTRRFDRFDSQTFAALALEDTSGVLFNTSALRGKTVYVDFWFTTCPPCIREIPYLSKLQQFFSVDTSIAFLSICIDNINTKTAWKQIIRDGHLGGSQLFYSRNRPQQINLLRKYEITFPTYLILNKDFKIIGYDAPRPSQTGWVEWAIINAAKNIKLADSYTQMKQGAVGYKEFIKKLKLREEPF